MNETLEIIKNIIVSLTASGVMSVIATLILKSIFSKRNNLLDITQKDIIAVSKLTNTNINTQNELAQATNKRLNDLDIKLDIVIKYFEKYEIMENNRTKQIEAIINEETKL